MCTSTYILNVFFLYVLEISFDVGQSLLWMRVTSMKSDVDQAK